MEDQIPSSLKWLVTKRSSIHGEILKAEKILEEYLVEHERKIRKLKRDLQAIDHTLGLHEILIDPNFIPPVRKHENRAKLKYGDVTRYIFECLKVAASKKLTTTEVAIYIADKVNLDLWQRTDFLAFRHTVRKRLKALRSQGKVKCSHGLHHNDERLWFLP